MMHQAMDQVAGVDLVRSDSNAIHLQGFNQVSSGESQSTFSSGYVLSEMAEEVQNIGQDCWDPCEGRSGFCSWCGHGNACCRRQFPSDPEECYGVPNANFIADTHQCVAAPRLEDRMARHDPSVFVSVFSRRGDGKRRGEIRHLWKRVEKSANNATVRFSICDGADNLDLLLRMEQKRYGDLLFLECEEGYAEGKLTKKVLASMYAYMNQPAFHKEIFMKVDDDTFLAWNRFSKFLKWRHTPKMYMGVPINQSVPCRNSSSRWYEPPSNFPRPLFPIGFAGGPGYVLSRDLVDRILVTGIADNNILYNEDRAVSVWVDRLVQGGNDVDYVSLAGISGFWGWDWKHPQQQWPLWKLYPNLVQHGLKGETIKCLSDADDFDDGDFDLRDCFSNEQGQEYTPLTCASENGDGLRLVEKLERAGRFQAMPDDMISLLAGRGHVHVDSHHGMEYHALPEDISKGISLLMAGGKGVVVHHQTLHQVDHSSDQPVV